MIRHTRDRVRTGIEFELIGLALRQANTPGWICARQQWDLKGADRDAAPGRTRNAHKETSRHHIKQLVLILGGAGVLKGVETTDSVVCAYPELKSKNAMFSAARKTTRWCMIKPLLAGMTPLRIYTIFKS